MDEHYQIGSNELTATINAQGAELSSLCSGGEEYLWQAGLVWPRHAPVLFPIVGRLPGDTLIHNGHSTHLPQHGFARDNRFSWLEKATTRCRLVLCDDKDTRAAYPFPFRFEVSYEIQHDTLTMVFLVMNTGNDPLPASIGAHPAFKWPLPGSVPGASHSLTFEAAEPAAIRRVSDGLLQPHPIPSPVVGDTLTLKPELFAADALIFDQIVSHGVRYGAPGARTIDIRWHNCPYLGVWSKSGGQFVCVEPWHGISTPVGYEGEFSEKPGLMSISPGQQASISVSVRILPRDPR